MKFIRANNENELISILAGEDIDVPARAEGRETEHCERWSIYRLLATLAINKKLMFPVELIKRERPDFLLKTGDTYIGIEITEITNPDYARATTMSEHNVEGTIIDPSLFKWGTPRRSKKELREIVSKKKLTGPGWEGGSVEVEYANAVYDVTLTKTGKLRSNSFDKFTKNWLVIYCNLTLPFLDVAEGNRMFEDKAKYYWGGDSFSNIFVERNDVFIFYSQGMSEIMKLSNLWNNG